MVVGCILCEVEQNAATLQSATCIVLSNWVLIENLFTKFFDKIVANVASSGKV